MQRSLLLRVASIGFLMALLLVPLWMIGGIVSERQHLQRQVDETIASSFAGPQRLAGPLLVIPYLERELVMGTDEKGKETKRIIEHSHQILLVPEQLTYDGAADVEAKYKGLYKTLVYQTKGVWRARFEVPANLGLEHNASRFTIGSAFLALGLSDVRGLRGSPKVAWSGQEITVKNGTNVDALGNGLHADVGDLTAREVRQYEVTVSLDLAGMRSLAFAPIGKNNVVQLRAAWPHPNFGGRFLPQTKQIDEQGFSARWEVSHLSSRNSDLLQHGLKEPNSLEAFDVSFIEPVNIYQQAERAVKYGVLFIALTFAAFFLFEILKDLRIHPLQYGLVGLALAVFFLLLVSLSEHIIFLHAYLAASVSCVLLIGYYLSHVLGGWRRGAAFAIKLALLYVVLYGLLLSEENALMLGSLLLFVALAAIMVLTRRIDWYRLGASKKALPE
ncbi:MAG: cell envelope integrity protein CreD [Betaproteobacteria bacterium]|nr:cell envelope integrity protein CreD [Betaproteobacteria bacterium]